MAAATVGIFLPAFVLVAVSAPLVRRLRRSPLAGAALDGVNVAAAVLLLRFRVGSAWLVAAGALAGGLRVALG